MAWHGPARHGTPRLGMARQGEVFLKALRHCGKRITGRSCQGIIVGYCDTCGVAVARVNPETGNTEAVDDGDAWSRKPREIIMTKREFKLRRKV